MGFLQRIIEFAKKPDADTRFLQQVDTGVQQMKDELDRLCKAAADALSHHNRLEADHERHVRQSSDWDRRAREALQMGDETLARRALERQSESDAQSQAMRPELEDSRRTTNSFSQQVAALRRKIAEAERNARVLVARKNAAKAQNRIADAMSGLNSNEDAFGTISRFEETVIEHEARARVLEDHLKQPASGSATNVDDKLEALKKQLGS